MPKFVVQGRRVLEAKPFFFFSAIEIQKSVLQGKQAAYSFTMQRLARFCESVEERPAWKVSTMSDVHPMLVYIGRSHDTSELSELAQYK